jgi:hypothetical protein
MPVVERTIHIGAPPDVVAGVLLDADLAPRWTAGLERIEVVAGEPGQPGCVGHAHYVERGRRHVLEDVLMEVVPNRRYRSRVRGGGIVATVETTLEPFGDDGTQLTLRWRGRGSNPLTMAALPLMKRRIAERADADLQALRRLAETDRPTSGWRS